MWCVYGKYHAPNPKQCKCLPRYDEEHYHESPKGTIYWNKIKWSDHPSKSPGRVNESECDLHKDDPRKLSFSEAFGRDYLSVVGVHAEGEYYDIVTGGMGLDNVAGDSIVKQQRTLQDDDWHRSILLREPRGQCGMNAAVILPPTCPCTDKGIIFMKNPSLRSQHDSYPLISVTGLMCATKVVLERETKERHGVDDKECSMIWDTVAGPVKATGLVRTSEKESRCVIVDVENIPSFVLELDLQVNCPAVGTVFVDIAFGGVFCAFVDACSLGLQIDLSDVKTMVELGEHIKDAINASYRCSHPDLPSLTHVSSVIFTEPVFMEDGKKMITMATVVSPGRLDRSPSGTATSARLAILHKRNEIGEEDVESQSVVVGRFSAAIVGHTKVGEYDAVLTCIGGRAWVTSTKQVGFEEDDRFLEGFQLEDLWGPSNNHDPNVELVGLDPCLDEGTLKRWLDRNELLGETY